VDAAFCKQSIVCIGDHHWQKKGERERSKRKRKKFIDLCPTLATCNPPGLRPPPQLSTMKSILLLSISLTHVAQATTCGNYQCPQPYQTVCEGDTRGDRRTLTILPTYCVLCCFALCTLLTFSLSTAFTHRLQPRRHTQSVCQNRRQRHIVFQIHGTAQLVPNKWPVRW